MTPDASGGEAPVGDPREVVQRGLYFDELDVGARYLAEVGGKLLTLRARIDNLTDRDHWSSVGGYPGTGYLVIGAPRTVSLSASVDF